MTNAEIIEELGEEYTTWFTPRFAKWVRGKFDVFGDMIQRSHNPNEVTSKEAEEFNKKWDMELYNFFMLSTREYIDIVLDSYNNKEIGKRKMKVYCKELNANLKDLQVGLNDFYPVG